MKYKVVISKLALKPVERRGYIDGKDGKAEYVTKLVDEDVEEEIFGQVVDELNLPAVIKAVNGL